VRLTSRRRNGLVLARPITPTAADAPGRELGLIDGCRWQIFDAQAGPGPWRARQRSLMGPRCGLR